MNRDKSFLRTFYDLKLPSSSSNNSGDSGVGEFFYASTSSSSSSVSLPSANQSHLLASLSVASLANVSVFENEEFFNYFIKLLQQFNFIDFNLKILQDAKPIDLPKPMAPVRKTSISQRRGSNIEPHVIQSPSAPLAVHTLPANTNNSINHQNNHNKQQDGGFNLKNISKKFNIKSWFTSNTPSPKLPNPISTSSQATNVIKRQKPTNIRNQQTPAESPRNVNKSSHQLARNASTNSNNPMKHSMSEPSLKAIL